MGQSNVKERIARRVAEELHDGDVVNLGIGLPSLVSNYIPDGVEIVLHGENGILGMGELSDGADSDYTVQNAGAQFIRHQPGAMYMNSAMSFVIIRGGHIDATVLGAFQVDKDGNLPTGSSRVEKSPAWAELWICRLVQKKLSLQPHIRIAVNQKSSRSVHSR